jgi:Fe-Mn family superoxide dismutase
METFTLKTFQIDELDGISAKNIEEHLKLYKGYVTNSNLILNKIKEYEKDPVENAYVLGELHRRFSFEFDGMRNHEYYFAHLSGGSKDLDSNGLIYKAIEREWGSFENWSTQFKSIAMTRGVGWAILYYDKHSEHLLNQWVDEHHLGQLTGLSPLLCLDMWEHAYVYDYPTSEKKKYVEAFFANLNWQTAEEIFKKII